MKELRQAIEVMTERIVRILEPCGPSVYLYGSAVAGDFRPGWSDIDILVLTREQISGEQAGQLLGLRQSLQTQAPENRCYRAFEGGMLSLAGFRSGKPDRVVYWGTSGQRVTDRYRFDSFCMSQLLDRGVLLFGPEIREQLRRPSYEALKTDVQRHYETIRTHARQTGRDLYAYGWLLDISRCIYTLRTGQILAKTAAGEWALAEGICPCPEALTRAVAVRKDPGRFLHEEETFDYAQTLGPDIQRYADVLERELGEGHIA